MHRDTRGEPERRGAQHRVGAVETAEKRHGLGRIPTLAALAQRDYRLLWTGMVSSNIGSWMQTFGLGWLVVQLAIADGTPHLGPLYLGIVNLARGLPGAAFALYAGVLADRHDRRRLLLAAQAVGLVSSFLLGLLTLAGRAHLAPIMVLAALDAMAHGLDGTTRWALVPRLVPPRDVLSALGLMQIAMHGSALVAPLIGGVLIGPLGTGGLFLLTALTRLPALGAMLAMRFPPRDLPRTRQGALAAIGEAVGHVRRDVVLLWALLFTVGIAFSVRSATQLLPSVVIDVFHAGAPELSWLLAGLGLGSLAGAILVAPFGVLRRRGLVLGAATLGSGAFLAGFVVQRALLPAMVLLALSGGLSLVSQGISNSLLMGRTPDHLRGRVASLVNLAFGGLGPAGAMVWGTLATFVGIDVALAAGGVVLAAVAAAALARVAALRALGPLDGAPWAARPPAP